MGLRGPGLRPQPHQHVVLPGGGKVGRRIGVFEDQVNVAAAQSFFDGGYLRRPLQLDGNRECVAVKDGRMNDLQGQRGPAAG